MTLAYLMRDSGIDFEPIREYIKELDIKIELVKLPKALGFAAVDTVYIDFLNIYYKDQFKGRLALFILLHEIGHIKRILANEKLRDVLDGEDFEAYYDSVFEEEEAANTYAIETFKALTNEDVPQMILLKQADTTSSDYRAMMQHVWETKNALGGWDKFIDNFVDRNYELVVKDITWNTMFEEEERLVRSCIGGKFYNPFEIPKDYDLKLYNPFTFEVIRASGDPVDDYNEKDVHHMNPFNSRYVSKCSYVNGKPVEAFRAVDDKWVECVQNENGEWV